MTILRYYKIRSEHQADKFQNIDSKKRLRE